MDTVTLSAPARRVIIVNRAATLGNTIYATINGADPTVAGDDTIPVVAGLPAYVTPESQTFQSSVDVVVKLISAATDDYSVMVEG